MQKALSSKKLINFEILTAYNILLTYKFYFHFNWNLRSLSENVKNCCSWVSPVTEFNNTGFSCCVVDKLGLGLLIYDQFVVFPLVELFKGGSLISFGTIEFQYSYIIFSKARLLHFGCLIYHNRAAKVMVSSDFYLDDRHLDANLNLVVKF